jgi:hypothetical protein
MWADTAWCFPSQRAPIWITLQYVDDGVGGRNGTERGDAGQRLEQYAPECPDVGALVDRLAACLLGTHVGNRAEDHPVDRRVDRRQRRRAGIGGRAQRRLGSGIRFGQAEVEQLHITGSSDTDVGRLQVSMHDATFVSRVERFGYLARNR